LYLQVYLLVRLCCVIHHLLDNAKQLNINIHSKEDDFSEKNALDIAAKSKNMQGIEKLKKHGLRPSNHARL